MMFTDEQFRISANLEQAYDALLEAAIQDRGLPRYMTWRTISGSRYLYQSMPGGSEKSLGRESEETLQIFNQFTERRERATERLKAANEKVAHLAALYRAVNLPQIMSMPARVLAEMDVRGMLGESFVVVGSTAFSAYEIEAGSRFMSGLDETEDFDLSWKPPVKSFSSPRSAKASSDMTLSWEGESATESTLLDVTKAVDKTFEVSMFAGHKVRNKTAFEIDVLCRPSDHFNSGIELRDKVFGKISPLEMEGQDLLHCGERVRHVVIGRGGIPAPLVAPDPRCMAIHKQWLSERPDRTPQKRRKDGRQAEALLDALKEMPRFPMNQEFIDTLPAKWQEVANSMMGSRANSTPKP